MSAPRSESELASRLAELTSELSERVTLDGLTRDFKMFQRRRGHRHSTDDLLTAWYAITHAPDRDVAALLDLGAGIGSVGLAVLWRFDLARLTAIEVQERSFRLLRENVWANGKEDRVRAIHGDLRHSVPSGESFDLVTGTPPYFDTKRGIVSADPQRAGARFELHGDVGDYCRAAHAALGPGSRFVFCFPTAQRERAEAACARAELAILTTRNVVPKAGLRPLFSLFACSRRAGAPHAEADLEPPLVVRDERGAHTAEMSAARALFGMGLAR